jgi:hypothetical protein
VQLAEPVQGACKVSEFCGKTRRQGVSPHFTEGLQKRFAIELLVGVGLSEVAEAVVVPAPAGGYWAIVVAEGGAEVFRMPELP